MCTAKKSCSTPERHYFFLLALQFNVKYLSCGVCSCPLNWQLSVLIQQISSSRPPDTHTGPLQPLSLCNNLVETEKLDLNNKIKWINSNVFQVVVTWPWKRHVGVEINVPKSKWILLSNGLFQIEHLSLCMYFWVCCDSVKGWKFAQSLSQSCLVTAVINSNTLFNRQQSSVEN